jgi:uncharacterized membrane protein
MYDLAVFWEWAAFAVRWLHVITAIAWIGSSFYFIALDLGLRQTPSLPEFAHGEEWQVHGGGFYHINKYLVAPAKMPEHLTWFKWESYATWLSGFALMCITYYGGAELYLIDRNILDVSVPTAIAISIASIAAGWIVYDLLCKSPLGKNTNMLMLMLYFVLVAMAWGYTNLFTGRAAFLHLGAFTATIMSANVFVIIIPNQKKVVASLLAGKAADPALGAQAKQRSLHNNYLTLPVIFLMLSNHNPLAFATQYSWIIASLVLLMGVTIRHYFNSKHARKGNPTWTWLATTILFILIVWLSSNPKLPGIKAQAAQLSSSEQHFIATAGFDAVRETVTNRCSMCHAVEPVWEGLVVPPKGVVLESDQAIARYAREIYLQAGRSHAMPPANLTAMESQERQAIVDWYQAAVSGS